MDGLSLDRRSDRGRRFAREMIAAASQADVRQRALLGPVAMSIACRTDDAFIRFVLGAFLPAPATMLPQYRFVLLRHGDLAKLPSTEWAREWKESGQPVPAVVTYPYRVFVDPLVGLVYVFDPMTRVAVVWIRRECELDLRSFLTPFRVLLSWIANSMNGEVVHASAAVIDGRGLLISGASGSGKSTLAIGLGLAGHRLISDDCLLVHEGTAYAVFARAKLDEASSALVGAGRLPLQALPGTPRAKSYFTVDELGEGFTRQHRLNTLGLAAIHPTSGHYAVTPRRAFQMLSTDSMREVMGGTTRNRLRIARLARSHAAQRLLLGPSMSANVAMVRLAVAAEREPATIRQETPACP
jgi:hypothetical protein